MLFFVILNFSHCLFLIHIFLEAWSLVKLSLFPPKSHLDWPEIASKSQLVVRAQLSLPCQTDPVIYFRVELIENEFLSEESWDRMRFDWLVQRFLRPASRATDGDEIICNEKEEAVCVFNHWWSNFCILYNPGSVIMLNNLTSSVSFHPVVAIKLFALYSSLIST